MKIELDKLVKDIIAHYEERENLVAGKGYDSCLFKNSSLYDV